MKILSPVNGYVKDIEESSDPSFSQKMLGDGVCIEPKDKHIYSPVKGKVAMVFPTKHALGIKCDDLEFMLHLGVDTVELQGEGFECFVKAGDQIDYDTLLIDYDYKKVAEKGNDTDIIFMILNNDTKELKKSLGYKYRKDEIISII